MIDFLHYTSAIGKSQSIAVDLVAEIIVGTQDGARIVRRDSGGIQTQDSVATLQALLDALREASQQLVLTDGISAPGATVGVARIYIDSADGDLKVKFGDGTTKTLATDT